MQKESKERRVFNEKTVKVTFRCPLSKKDEFQKEANLLLDRYDVRIQSEGSLGGLPRNQKKYFENPPAIKQTYFDVNPKKIEPTADDKVVQRVEGFSEKETAHIQSEIKSINDEKTKVKDLFGGMIVPCLPDGFFLFDKFKAFYGARNCEDEFWVKDYDGTIVYFTEIKSAEAYMSKYGIK